MQDYQDKLAIATPEGLTIELVLGGLGSRFTAALVDIVLKVVIILAILGVMALAGGFGVAAASILTFVVYIGYDIAFECLARGRTPGKRLTGLRVLRTDGRPVDPLSSAIRNVIRIVDGVSLAYIPGMLSVLLTRRNQRLGDLAAGTIVVREEPVDDEAAPGSSPAPEPAAPWPAPAWPATGDGAGFTPPVAPSASGLALDLTAITAQDVVALRAFAARRTGLEDSVRTDLAARLAGAVRPRIGGATDGLGDEALIDAVLRGKADR
jgi:uncharacterized RDD family membrane protein YckC